MQTLRGYLHAVQISQTLLVEKKLTKNTINELIHDHTVYIQFLCTYILDVSQCFNTAYGARMCVWVYYTSMK